MTMTFPQFISQTMDNPVLLVTVLLTLADIMKNTWFFQVWRPLDQAWMIAWSRGLYIV